jgi:hypothetical protein
VNAEPFLAEIARHLHDLHFDAVLTGNAAAALQGAPVTRVDLDFMFRKTAVNLRKLKALAGRLGATVFRPWYPASDTFRVVRDDDGLQLKFIATIHAIEIDSMSPRMVLPSDSSRIKKSPRSIRKRNGRARTLAALRRESDRALVDLIRRRLALPLEKRMNFLRKRVGARGSAL